MIELSIQYAPTFLRTYKRLHPVLKTEVKQKIEQFKDPKQHKALRVHKLKSLKNTYAFSVNYETRIIFQYESPNLVSLLYVGTHDEVY